jgi:hypothetical protein
MWRVTWRLHNRGGAPLSVESAWVPHGRFRGESRLTLEPARHIGPGQSTELELLVHAQEAPGTVVENTFLILLVVAQQAKWRVFTRMRVEFEPDGTPRPVPEVLTLQSSGGTD